MRARHPHAAKLFGDFLLSKEGRPAANVIGSYPANAEVESELRKETAGYRLHPVNPKMMSRFDEINKTVYGNFLEAVLIFSALGLANFAATQSKG